MNKIINYTVYNNRMQNTLQDKIWFLDEISNEINTIIDFGCADGELFKTIEKKQPNKFYYIGIDNDEMMRLKAKTNLQFIADRVDIFSSLEDLKLFDIPLNNCILVMNSIIHEIYSYCSYIERMNIFKRIRNSGIKYIAVRDMHLITDDCGGYIANFCNLSNKHQELFKQSKDYVYHQSNVNQTLEFLLKYFYQENWEREKRERYLWDWSEEFQSILHNYQTKKHIPFSIPYLANKWKNDFGIEFNYYTHRKLLLELK